MRALLINPELLPSFWTLGQVCESVGRKATSAPLGLLTVAAMLPPDWELRLVDLNARRLAEADWAWADLVMLSGMLVQRDSLLALIPEAKQRGKTVVVGGPYPTSVPQPVLDAGADFLFRGECEDTLPLFLSALSEGNKKGIFEATERPDLKRSPAPRFDLLNLDDYLTLGVQTSRGCPFNCEFCDVVQLYGRRPRHKTADQVLAELEAVYRLGWRREIFICDDNFVGRRGHALAILGQLIPWMKSHGEPFTFWTQASVNLGQDQEMIDLLTEANFSYVFIGVESPDEAVLTLNRKYQNIKNPLGRSLTNICANGLSVMASFVMGFDNEEKGVGDRICDFVEEHGIPLVIINTLSVFPNTNLWDRLKQEGRLLEERTTGLMEGARLNYRPTRPEAEIMTEYRRAVDRLYEPRAFLARAHHYYRTMRPTRRALAFKKGERTPLPVNQERPPRRPILKDLQIFLKFLWRHGVLAEYRGQFLRQLLDIYRHNPSRLIKYINCCHLGENLFRLRDELLRKPIPGHEHH